MNYKKIVKEILSEIIHDQMKPTMKYYAFDWDDNLMYMPTKIYLVDEDGESVGMSTEDFAEYRKMCGEVKGLLTARLYIIDLQERVNHDDDDE